MKRAVFLDRDGTLIREVGYLSRLEDLEILPGVPAALAQLAEEGYLRLVVTNQSGVARGFFDGTFVDRVHGALAEALRRKGAGVEGFYVCPHHPRFTGPCGCRKPAAGLVDRAAAEWELDLGRSWVVGDKLADLELARRAGCRSVLVRTGYGRETEDALGHGGLAPDLIADDLAAAVAAMVGE